MDISEDKDIQIEERYLDSKKENEIPAVIAKYHGYVITIRYFDDNYQKHLAALDFKPGYFSYLLKCPNEDSVFNIFPGVNMGGNELRLFIKIQEMDIIDEEDLDEFIEELKDAKALYQISGQMFDKYFPNVFVRESEEISEHDYEFDEWFKNKWMKNNKQDL